MHTPSRQIDRRQWLRQMTAFALPSTLLAGAALLQTSQAHGKTRRLKVLLNTGFSSPQAWLWHALAAGYFAAEGIELELTPGGGAYTAAPRLAAQGFDFAYGDINALIETCARRSEPGPRAVYMMFNASPSCVVVDAEGPIRHPRQLLGKRLIGHDSDVGLRTFGAVCHAQGMQLAQMDVSSAWAGMSGMVEDVLAGRAGGAFGYESTFTGALVASNPGLLNRVRFLRFVDWAPDLYGSALMASPAMLREEPDIVRRMVRAVNRGVQDMLNQPDVAFESVLRAHPGLSRHAEHARLKATLALEMNPALPTGHSPTGLGEADMARLQRSIGAMVQGNQLPRTPTADEVFTADHLPPLAQRRRTA